MRVEPLYKQVTSYAKAPPRRVDEGVVMAARYYKSQYLVRVSPSSSV